MLRSQPLTPSFAGFLVALGTAFAFAGCSSSSEPEGAAGTGGGSSGATGSPGGSGGTAGSPTTAGAGFGGSGGSTAGITSSSGSGGSTGGAGAGTAGTAGVTSNAGTGGAGKAGAGGSPGGAGSGGTGGLAMGGAGAGGTGGGTGGATGGAGASGGSSGEDLDIQAEQFSCIADWDQVLGFRINNLLGHLPEAIAVAESGTGVYPVGTIIQHLPTEAMVKRRAGFSPETNDWEFFLLQLSPQGETTIVERGTTEIETTMGDTCVSCHTLVPDEYDFVCNTWGEAGSDNCGFDFMDSFLNQQLMSDTRCD